MVKKKLVYFPQKKKGKFFLLMAAAFGIDTVKADPFTDRTTNGVQSLKNVTTSLSGSYFGPLVDLMYAIGAILGLIGAYKVYTKMQAGDQDVGKSVAGWFGGCIFLVVCAALLNAFFLT